MLARNVNVIVRFSELREQITPEIMELIKQQRLNYLVEGTRFTKYSKGQRMKGELTKKSHTIITSKTILSNVDTNAKQNREAVESHAIKIVDPKLV